MSGPEAATEIPAGGEPAMEGQNSGEAPELAGAAGSTPATPPVEEPAPKRAAKPKPLATQLRKEAASIWSGVPAKLVEAKLAIVTLFATRGQTADVAEIIEGEEAYRISNTLGEALERKVTIEADLLAGTGTLTSAATGRVLRFSVDADGVWAYVPDAPEQPELGAP